MCEWKYKPIKKRNKITAPHNKVEIAGETYCVISLTSQANKTKWIRHEKAYTQLKHKSPSPVIWLHQWAIKSNILLSDEQHRVIDKLETELSPYIKKFDYGEVMTDLTTFIMLEIDSAIRVNLTAYDGDMSEFYLSFFSEGHLIRQDMLDHNRAIIGIKEISERLKKQGKS